MKRIFTLYGKTYQKYDLDFLRYFWKSFSTETNLKTVLKQKILDVKDELIKFKKENGSKKIGEITVDMCIGGMRGIPGLLWETSLLDQHKGILFRDYNISEIKEKLPSAIPNGEPLPEGLLWLLLSGEIPTNEQVSHLSMDLKSRENIPEHVIKIIESMPIKTHPMTLFSQSILAMQPGSKFAEAYQKGIPKSELWEYYYEDSLNLISNLPQIASIIYRKVYKDGIIIPSNKELDWSANLIYMMGNDSVEAMELMRMYLTIHSDHEGGNVSAHTTHLVGSALSDPYLSYSSGLNGLAGPLHGLANQEVLRWLKDIRKQIGDDIIDEKLKEYVKLTLNSGKVIPGYGHAVLRVTDPRYICQKDFANKYLPSDPLYKLANKLYNIVPNILKATGKVKNPWPNVDANSGILLQYYGIIEENFYTVLFGVSRALGVLSQGVWSRALGLPIERPKSLTIKALKQLIKNEKSQ